MTDVAGEPTLVERELSHGRVQLALVDYADAVPVDACALTIDPLELYGVDGSLVRVGGIGNVETLESHRRRGLASRLVEIAIERMRADGYAASLLYGIDHFYDRFGWISCGDERWIRVKLDSVATQRHAWQQRDCVVRPMRTADRPVLAELYEQIASRIPGAASRRGGRAWARLRESEVLVVELAGEVRGWAWRGSGDVPERDSLDERSPGCVAYAELQAIDAPSMLALLDGVSERERVEHPHDRELVTGACDGSSLRDVAHWFDNVRTDETRRFGGAMLLTLDEAGAAPIDDDLYQFLPDRF